MLLLIASVNLEFTEREPSWLADTLHRDRASEFSKDKIYYLREGFEEWPPSGWTLLQNADSGPGWRAYTGFQDDADARVLPIGKACAWHNDDRAQETFSDWLISPPIDLTSAQFPLLVFHYHTRHAPMWTEYRGIWVGTDPNDTASFTELSDESMAYSPYSWSGKGLSLSAYAGQVIYIAFVYRGSYADEWYIDNVIVVERSQVDLSVAGGILRPEARIEKGQVIYPEVSVSNTGLNDISDTFGVELLIFDSLSSVIYGDTQLVFGLGSGESRSVVFDSWRADAEGVFSARASLLFSDDEPRNDTDTVSFFVYEIQQFINVPRANAAPTLDGVLEPGEWDDAVKWDISNYLGNGDEDYGFPYPPRIAFAYVKHDGLWLYLAVDLPCDSDAPWDYDQLITLWDDNADGTWAPDSSEGQNNIVWGEGWVSRWIRESNDSLYFGYWGYRPDLDTCFGISALSGHTQVEMKLKIVSPQAKSGDPAQISAGPGDTVGVFIAWSEYHNAWPNPFYVYYAWWPQVVNSNYLWTSLARFGRFVLDTTQQGLLSSSSEETLVRALPTLYSGGPIRVLLNLPRASSVEVMVYDAAGRQVCSLYQGTLPEGKHELRWNADGVKPGVYLITAEVDDLRENKKILIR